MILSGHQPCYPPGIQLFNKNALSDAFMFVGHCEYQPKSWHSHNFIRTGKLTVPIQRPHNLSINEVQIDGEYWKRKHIKSIRAAYRNFRYFDDYFPALREIISDTWSTLGELNVAIILQLLLWLDIKTKILNSRNHIIGGTKQDLLIRMCKAVGANEYLSNEGSRDYIGPLQEVKMREAGVAH